MKKIYTLYNLLIGASLLLLSACQTTDDMLEVIDTAANAEALAGTPVRLDASSFALPEVGTRAAATFPVNGSTMTVGMTVSGTTTYADYTYDGTTWKADETPANKVLRWGDADAEHSFIAVSPKRDMSSLNYTLPGIFTKDNVTACDGLLTTTAALTTKPANSISLSMKHALVKFTILSSSSSVVLKGQTLTTEFDAAAGALKAVSHNGVNGTITMYKSAANTFVGYMLPRTEADGPLAYIGSSDKKFPATDMPAGSNFKCSDLTSTDVTITSTAGGLEVLLASKAMGATILRIEGTVNDTDMIALRTFLLKESCIVEELYVNAEGTETLNVGLNNGAKQPTSLAKIIYFKTKSISINNAFKLCKSLVSVSMPSLESMPMGCFNECVNLMDVDLPNLKTLIAGWHFAKCAALETIYLPKLSSTTTDNIFAECPNLKKIILPSLSAMPIADNNTNNRFTSIGLSVLVLKTADKFDKAKLLTASAAINPTLFVTDAVSPENMNTALSSKYDGAKAYSTYKTSIPMTAESLVNPDNYSVTWTKP